MPLLKRLAKSRYFCTCSIFNNQYNTMKSFTDLIISLYFFLSQPGAKYYPAFPTPRRRGPYKQPIEKASMNGSFHFTS